MLTAEYAAEIYEKNGLTDEAEENER